MFISKLADAEGEAAETQVWLEVATKCSYLQRDVSTELYKIYSEIIGTLVGMITHPESWIIQKKTR
jgi:four helix bundle protein